MREGERRVCVCGCTKIKAAGPASESGDVIVEARRTQGTTLAAYLPLLPDYTRVGESPDLGSLALVVRVPIPTWSVALDGHVCRSGTVNSAKHDTISRHGGWPSESATWEKWMGIVEGAA